MGDDTIFSVLVDIRYLLRGIGFFLVGCFVMLVVIAWKSRET